VVKANIYGLFFDKYCHTVFIGGYEKSKLKTLAFFNL